MIKSCKEPIVRRKLKDWANHDQKQANPFECFTHPIKTIFPYLFKAFINQITTIPFKRPFGIHLLAINFSQWIQYDNTYINQSTKELVVVVFQEAVCGLSWQDVVILCLRTSLLAFWKLLLVLQKAIKVISLNDVKSKVLIQSKIASFLS